LFRYFPGRSGKNYKKLRSRQQVTGSGIPRGVKIPPPPKFRSFDKAEPNSQFSGKYIHNNLIRIWVSLSGKLSGTPD
jgi:hypothetical protein